MLAGYLIRHPAEAGQESEPSISTLITDSLASMTERIDLVESNRLAQMVSDALVLEKDNTARQNLLVGLFALTFRGEPSRASKVISDLFERTDIAATGEVLLRALTRITASMPKDEKFKIYDRAGDFLADALERETNVSARQVLANSLTTWLSQENSLLDSIADPKVCGHLAHLLAGHVAREKDQQSRWRLVKSIASLAGRMNPTEANSLCVPVARFLADAAVKESDAEARLWFALELTRATSRISMTEAGQFCGPHARAVIKALEKEPNTKARWSLVRGLVTLSIRLAPEDAVNAILVAFRNAARMVRGADDASMFYDALPAETDPIDVNRRAQLVMAALNQEKNVDVRWCLAVGIASLVVHMKSNDAARIYGPALPHLALALVQRGDCEY